MDAKWEYCPYGWQAIVDSPMYTCTKDNKDEEVEVSGNWFL